MKPWIRYVIAAVVAAHGLVYLNAARGVLPVFEGWKGRAWLLGDAITGDSLKRLCQGMWAVAGIGVIATGVALAFAFSAQAVWRPLAIVASTVAILSFLVFWDGQVRRLFEQGVIGVVLSLLILLGALAFPRLLGAGAS